MDKVDVPTPAISCYALLADSKSLVVGASVVLYMGVELVSWHSDSYLLVSRHGASEKYLCSKTSKVARRMQRVTVWLFYLHTKSPSTQQHTHIVYASAEENREQELGILVPS